MTCTSCGRQVVGMILGGSNLTGGACPQCGHRMRPPTDVGGIEQHQLRAFASADAAEGMAAFFEKRSPRWKTKIE